jgi:hypothetical protein
LLEFSKKILRLKENLNKSKPKNIYLSEQSGVLLSKYKTNKEELRKGISILITNSKIIEELSQDDILELSRITLVVIFSLVNDDYSNWDSEDKKNVNIIYDIYEKLDEKIHKDNLVSRMPEDISRWVYGGMRLEIRLNNLVNSVGDFDSAGISI